VTLSCRYLREIHLGVKDNAGEKCYTGSKTNICNLNGKLCDIFEKHKAHLAKEAKNIS